MSLEVLYCLLMYNSSSIQSDKSGGRIFPHLISEGAKGGAFELYISYPTHREEWGTMHPDRGARFLDTWSRGVAPKTRGSGIASDPATPLGCRTE